MPEPAIDKGRMAAAVAAAFFTVVVWGATPPITKAVTASIDPLLVAVMRTMLAVAPAILILAILRLKPPAATTDRILLCLSGISGFIGFPIVFTLGVGRTTASHSALILAALPVITGLIAHTIDRRRPTRNWILGSAIALAGEAALIGSRAQGGEATLAGDAMVLTGGIIACIGYVAGGRLQQRGYPAASTTFWGVVLGGALLAPFALPVIAAADWQTVTPSGWTGLAYLALMSTTAAYIAWYWALGVGGIARIGLLQFFQPPVGVALAVAWLGEPLTLPLVLSGLAILAGVFIAQRR